MKNHIPENYEAQRHNHEYLRAQFEQRQIERARIHAACGTMHPAAKVFFWIACLVPPIATAIYLLTK